MTNDEWSPRLEDRFKHVDKQLEELQLDVRTFAPVVGQVVGLEADVEGVQRALTDVRGDLRDLQRESAAAVRRAEDAAADAIRRADSTANDVIRSGRTENLKLIGIVLGTFTTVVVGIATALLTGKIG